MWGDYLFTLSFYPPNQHISVQYPLRRFDMFKSSFFYARAPPFPLFKHSWKRRKTNEK